MKFSHFISAAILTVLLTSAGRAQNKLSVLRAGGNAIEISLENSQLVAGMQFRIASSADIMICAPERSGRITDLPWLVASAKPNDSTVTVVLFSSDLSELGIGSGSILRFSFTPRPGNSQLTSRVSITNVMVANARAESLAVVVQNLEFSTRTEPPAFVLGQNFPNPFNPTTQLTYRLNKTAQVRLAVYDVAGREISRLVDGFQDAGDFSVVWEGTDDARRPVPSGVYFAQLRVDWNVATQKMIFAK